MKKESFIKIMDSIEESMRRSEQMGKDFEALVEKHRGDIANDFFSGAEIMFTDDKLYDDLLLSLETEFEDENTGYINAFVFDMDFGKDENANRLYISKRPYVVNDKNKLYNLLSYNLTGVKSEIIFPYVDKVRLVKKRESVFGSYESFEVDDVMEDKVGLQEWLGCYLSPNGNGLRINSDLCDFDIVYEGDVIVRRSGTGKYETLFTKYTKEEYEKMFYAGDED